MQEMHNKNIQILIQIRSVKKHVPNTTYQKKKFTLQMFYSANFQVIK